MGGGGEEQVTWGERGGEEMAAGGERGGEEKVAGGERRPPGGGEEKVAGGRDSVSGRSETDFFGCIFFSTEQRRGGRRREPFFV